MPVLDLQISASGNDAAEASGGVVDVVATTHRLLSTSALWVGLRFVVPPESDAIPAGSTITAAYVETFCNNASRDSAGAAIYCEDADSPAAFAAAANDITARPRTAASVNWSQADILGETKNQWIQWPSLVSIIQEVVDRPGFDGRTIAILATDTGGSDLQLTTYDGNPSNAPKLHIEYTAPGLPVAVVAAHYQRLRGI